MGNPPDPEHIWTDKLILQCVNNFEELIKLITFNQEINCPRQRKFLMYKHAAEFQLLILDVVCKVLNLLTNSNMDYQMRSKID